MTHYKGGRIKRIKVKDFMTFDELELIPKNGLNIIIGLNGSGKSSIMAAICLGLTGKPQLTGKSNQLKDFIKHGKEKAIIEIELEDPTTNNVVIRRVIEGEKTTWFLNNKCATSFQVNEIVKKYNIDVSNICQFLPQEKVSEFSKMDKKLRLENMIQAIGEPHLLTLFNELKADKVELNNMEKEMLRLQSGQSSEVQKNERLRTEVDKHDQRMKLEEELNNKKIQKIFAEYEKLQCEVKVKKEERKGIAKEIAIVRKDLEKSSSEADAVSSEYSDIQKNIKNADTRTTQAFNKFTQLSEKFSELHEEVDCAKVEFQNKIDEKQNQKTRLADLERQIKGLQLSVKQHVPEKKIIQDKTNQINQELERIRQQMSHFDSEYENIKLQINRYEYEGKGHEAQLNRARNEQNKQMEFLKQRYRHTYDAVCWLEQNQSSFKSTICPPALLSIKVKRDEDRQFVENTIAERDLKSFICMDEGDVKRLTDILLVQMKLKVNIGLAPQASISDFQPPPITPEMRRMGIKCFLSDLITAPEPLMCYLCKLYKLNCIPICDATAENYVDTLLPTFRVVFTPTERISGKKSKYGNQNLSMKRDHLRVKNLIRSTRDDSALIVGLEAKWQEAQKQVSNLSAQCQTYLKQRSALEREQEQHRLEKNQLTEETKKIQNLEMQLRQKTETYRRKVNETVNEEEEKEKVTKKIHSFNVKRMSIMTEMEGVLKDYLAYKVHKIKQILYAKLGYKKLTSLKTKVKEKQNVKETLDRKLDETTAEYHAIKEKASQLLPKIKELSRDLLDFLTSHMAPIEQIEEEIVRIQAQLDLDYEDNAAVVQEYKNREKAILNIGERIAALESRLNLLKVNIENKKQQWLPPLEFHIKTINKKFSQYYKLLRCAGEISLDTGEDPDDFANYGLEIWLKYRDNELFSLLSPERHSGGECNVAAVIFILSLQELSRVPFRCVDEINQGMDSSNERKMYQLIADDASKKGSCSQYFLLTPKLLKDMTYHQDVAVHIIFNSRYLNTKLNIRQHLDTYKMNQ